MPAEPLYHSLEAVSYVLLFLVLCFKDVVLQVLRLGGLHAVGKLCSLVELSDLLWGDSSTQGLLLVQPHSHPLAAK